MIAVYKLTGQIKRFDEKVALQSSRGYESKNNVPVVVYNIFDLCLTEPTVVNIKKLIENDLYMV